MTIQLKVSPLYGIDALKKINSEFTQSRLHPVQKILKPHLGVDIAVPRGTGVLSVDDGVVESVVNMSPSAGNLVVIRHSNYKTRYLHLDRFAAEVTAGTPVRAGRLIGYVGNTGADSSGPHLHFEVLQVNGNNSTPVNPRPLLQNLAVISINDPRNQNLFETQIRPYANPVNSTPANVAPPAVPNSSLIPVSPYILTTDSFHPKVQFELSRRRLASETANVYMPFAQLTALLHVLPNHLQGEAPQEQMSFVNVDERREFYKHEIERVTTYCPSLGINGQREISFEDMYLPQQNRSTIGYATRSTNNGTIRIPLVVEESTFDAPNIPPAGITSISIERSVAGPMGIRGGLFRATINIVANSIGQLNGLLKYFLRPGTKVVLELGRISTSQNENQYTFFNWNRRLDAIKEEIEEIGFSRGGTAALMDKYVYGNYGNYEMFFGFVANFKLKYDKKNKYNITLTVQSLQQFEVPLKNTGTKSLCTTRGVDSGKKAIGIADYFSDAENWKLNSFSKLLGLVGNTPSSDRRGRPNPFDAVTKSQVIRLTAGDSSDGSTSGYLIHWKFFINVILHDETHGIMSVFNLNNTDERNVLEMLRRALPPKYDPIQLTNDEIDGIVDYQVPWQPTLRSTNPDVMVIFNPTAQQNERVARQNRIAENRDLAGKKQGGSTSALLYNRLVTFGDGTNYKALAQFIERSAGLSSLMNGVWLNSNAIRRAFEKADTLSSALVNLLNEMNSSTEGFWNLQLLSDDTNAPGTHIVDMGISKDNKQSSPPPEEGEPLMLNAVQSNPQKLTEFQGTTPSKPKYIYRFNRKLRASSLQTENDNSTGGDAIDLSIQSGMPNVVMVQVISGVAGLGQRGTLASIDVDELKALSIFDTYPTCAPASSSAVGGSNTFVNGSNINIAGNMLITAENARKFATEAFERGLSKVESSVVNEYVKNQQAIDKFPIYGGPQIKPPRGFFGGGGNMLAHRLVHQTINAEIKKVEEEYYQDNSTFKKLVENYWSSFGSALELIEWNPAVMLQEIEEAVEVGPSKQKKVHPFNSSNLTKTIIEVTTAGIGGIQPWQCFEVDRVPSFLRNGYYQVVKLNHELSPSKGWTTKITGRFRFDPKEDTE